ncbi:hypothetical protein UY3_00804 [Chelonia mydas]|uniref:Uncharacterized protein n=1 Tax=Chelonia mydas TaxID=8469 RepID=M7CB89_CHEMY|nr:hypothetical protein UY3_00804 [Chelonia mydas]
MFGSLLGIKYSVSFWILRCCFKGPTSSKVENARGGTSSGEEIAYLCLQCRLTPKVTGAPAATVRAARNVSLSEITAKVDLLRVSLPPPMQPRKTILSNFAFQVKHVGQVPPSPAQPKHVYQTHLLQRSQSRQPVAKAAGRCYTGTLPC